MNDRHQRESAEKSITILEGHGPHYDWNASAGGPDPTLRIALDGEIDLGAVEEIWPKLEQAIDGDRSFVVLDLSGVRFIDSTGLRLLLRIKRQVEESASRLLLGNPSSVVLHLLELTKLTDEFEYIDHLESHTVWCPVCGTELEPADEKCSHCGSSF